MQKWEYLWVEFSEYKKILRPKLINEVEVKDWKTGPYMMDYINRLGGEGWELISFDLHTRVWAEAIFKRPNE